MWGGTLYSSERVALVSCIRWCWEELPVRGWVLLREVVGRVVRPVLQDLFGPSALAVMNSQLSRLWSVPVVPTRRVLWQALLVAPVITLTSFSLASLNWLAVWAGVGILAGLSVAGSP